MTINELLEQLGSAFPIFTASQVRTWAPIYRAALGQYEGPQLAKMFSVTLQEFEATPRAAYPSPKHFLRQLPPSHPKIPGDGGSIRQPLKDQADRKERAFRDWHAGQGAKIKAARPKAVYCACVLEAQRLAKSTGRVILTAEQIETCEARALSAARVAMFGSLPRTNEEWTLQIEQARPLP